ncbi:MAG: dihydroorotase [Bacteroidaceae bacterium]
MKKLIKNALIVNEGSTRKGAVLLNNDTIEQIYWEELPSECDAEVIDAEGLYLLPGVIDDHVHFREPGLTDKADLASESAAAVAGGVTSIMDMPNVQPQTTTLEALQQKFALAATKCHVNYSFYFGATNKNTALLPLLDPTEVCGVKLFMGASTGNMLVDNKQTVRTIFETSPVLVAVHCEDSSRIKENAARIRKAYGETASIHFHPIIRDAEACYASSSIAVELAKKTKARLHLLHLTTGKELELLSDLPIQEKRITAEVCLPHLLFSSDDYTTLGSAIKCNPAIKEKHEREALRQAITTNRIDVIATDHAPHLLSDKQGGCLQAASGMPMLQYSLISMIELVREKVLSLEQVVQKMCHAPAQLFQIEKRGFIREGYKADLTLVDPSITWTLTNEDIKSKCGWSPLENRTFHSRVVKTFVNGHLIYNQGTINEAPKGEKLHFKR